MVFMKKPFLSGVYLTKTKGKRYLILWLLVVGVLTLAGLEVSHRLRLGELAAQNGVSLSGEVVNLTPYLNEGSGRVDYTYEELREMYETPVYGDFDSLIYGGPIPQKNCFPSRKRTLPLRAFKSKESVYIQWRVYSSYLETPKGERLFINGPVLFDEKGYLYFTLSDVREAMEKSCPETRWVF